MDNHLLLELQAMARYYERLCQRRGLKAPKSPASGDLEALARFGEFYAVAEGMGLNHKEYLDLVVEQCARRKKRPPVHSSLAKTWTVEIVNRAKMAKETMERSKIRGEQVIMDNGDDQAMIQQLRSFARFLQRSYGQMMTEDFSPNGWKVIYTKRKGVCLADSLLERGMIPDVFMYLSNSWQENYPMEYVNMETPSYLVIQCFEALFPGDLDPSVVDMQRRYCAKTQAGDSHDYHLSGN